MDTCLDVACVDPCVSMDAPSNMKGNITFRKMIQFLFCSFSLTFGRCKFSRNICRLVCDVRVCECECFTFIIHLCKCISIKSTHTYKFRPYTHIRYTYTQFNIWVQFICKYSLTSAISPYAIDVWYSHANGRVRIHTQRKASFLNHYLSHTVYSTQCSTPPFLCVRPHYAVQSFTLF